MRNYEDMLHLERPAYRNHRPMPLINRAAQFGAFRALEGYHESIREEARITDSMIEHGSEFCEELNHSLMLVREKIDEMPQLSVTYFVPDEKKAGGSFVEYSGRLRLIDDVECVLIFADGMRINFADLLELKIMKSVEKDEKR